MKRKKKTEEETENHSNSVLEKKCPNYHSTIEQVRFDFI